LIARTPTTWAMITLTSDTHSSVRHRKARVASYSSTQRKLFATPIYPEDARYHAPHGKSNHSRHIVPKTINQFNGWSFRQLDVLAEDVAAELQLPSNKSITVDAENTANVAREPVFHPQRPQSPVQVASRYLGRSIPISTHVPPWCFLLLVFFRYRLNDRYHVATSCDAPLHALWGISWYGSPRPRPGKQAGFYGVVFFHVNVHPMIGGDRELGERLMSEI
jgi:hypothetical protein